jgi:hypothetical protein
VGVQEDNVNETNTTSETGQWAILELMGRKVVAGYLSKDTQHGSVVLRIDVPATSAFPAFTQEYGLQAMYCITYVSEEVARLTAEHTRVNPISVYVPDLQDMRRVRDENEQLRDTVRQLRERLSTPGLPQPKPDPLGFPDGTELDSPDDDDEDEDER